MINYDYNLKDYWAVEIMLKRKLDYDSMKAEIKLKAEEIKISYDPDLIVANIRGGMTIAHILSKYLRLSVGSYYPATGEIYLPYKKKYNRILIVEDLIASGNTFRLQKELSIPDTKIKNYTYLIDEDYTGPMPDFWSLKAREWIVFPWEDYHLVSAGDRGLFREGTDSYGK